MALAMTRSCGPIQQRLGARQATVAFLACLLALFGAPCAVAFEMPTSWQSTHFRDNPLVGTIRTGSGVPVEPAAFAKAIAAADIVLAGETHDNPDHHLLQARLIEALIAAGHKPAVVFEMIPVDLQPAIDAYLAASPADAGGFGAAVRWTERGWPDFAIYSPILETALPAGLVLRAGDLPRETIRKIGREGTAALTPADAERLSLSGDLPAEEVAELSSTLKDTHCGLLPDTAIAPMLTVQRARDGALTDATATAASEAGGKAVLIAGSGHTRKDWAVGSLLPARLPGARIVSIALTEVSEGEEEPEGYGLGPNSPAPYDYVLFTPRANVSDPCEGMAEAMGRSKDSSGGESGGEATPAE